MPATAAIVGAGLGVFIQLYSNAIRKMPLNRHPWEHLLYAGIGAYAGNALIAWEERTEIEIQEILKQREESNKKLQTFQ